MAITGGCHCGAIRYAAAGAYEHHALCHCTDCRRWSGAPMVGWIAFRDDQVTVNGTPARYASSEHGVREFCAACGTGLFYCNPAVLPGLIDIQTGTLDAPQDHPPSAHIMCKEKLSWVDGIGSLPTFATYPGVD
ncbi:hypothetical protein J2Y58_002878 [Sphingomonas sp. BE138]|uniref:GFA family protein n=1 Tax=Sphingomonas sp. BE138 TaxID=2817845 RepID=UPI00285B781F|nr:GFA family protein [Sphingomonas sp. BE138]MDR6789505.1 hypothetical protein [Sphingomonas sp. BE138]